MIKGIYSAGRSLNSKFKNIEVIGNNLANVNTTGFKKAVNFTEVLNKIEGTKIRSTTNFTDGNLVSTGNMLDLSLKGNAFFSVIGENGIEYTRNGRFSVSDEGFLVTESGMKVNGKDGPINLNDLFLEKDQSLIVSKEGEVKSGEKIIGNLQLYAFNRGDELIRTDGAGFFTEQVMIPAEAGSYQVLQGYLEESNVNPIDEMTQMIKVHNEYDSASKMVSYLDQSLEKAMEIGRI